MDLFSIILIVSSVKKKAYPYLVSGIICLLYTILYQMSLKPPLGLSETVAYDVINFCERLLPFVLFACVFSISRKKNEKGKRNYLPAIISGIICIIRIVRSIWSRYFFQMLLGATSEEAYELAAHIPFYYNINTVIILCLYTALIIILLWHMKKYGSGKEVRQRDAETINDT